MRFPIPRFVRRPLRILLLLLAGGLLTALVGIVLVMNNQPDLQVWHTAKLTEEFTEDSEVASFAEYLALEDRLFAQLGKLVCDEVPPEYAQDANRFHRGSLSDPERWDRNWNRTWELPIDAPKAGVLLLHGLSDSPYSLRTQGELLNERGAWVVGLRIPGHGTAPSGLLRTTWEDMAAAVRLAVRHVAEKVGDRPVYLVGYSNGAALSVHYALQSLDDDSLPRVNHLVLHSPAIGITAAAALAPWQGRLGRLLGLEKLAWTNVLPEYDPYKYQSFTINAAVQTWRLTGEIARLIEARGGRENLEGFPPTLAFQSGLDATVSTPAVISALFQKLPDRGHHLVIYDLNRMQEIEHLLTHDPREQYRQLLMSTELTFTITAVTNESDATRRVVARTHRPGDEATEEVPLDMEWPLRIFSLAHVALPFPREDPLYGDGSESDDSLIQIGGLALRGEKSAIMVPAGEMLRQRWNPFHAWQQQQMVEFLGM